MARQVVVHATLLAENTDETGDHLLPIGAMVRAALETLGWDIDMLLIETDEPNMDDMGPVRI